MKKFLFALAIAACAVAPQARAQSAAGEWDATMNTPGGPRAFKVVLQQKGDSLSGTVKRSAGDVPLAGSVKGSDITFWYTIDYGGNALTLTVTAKLAGDEMKGTIDMGGNASDSFAAKRTPKPPAFDR